QILVVKSPRQARSRRPAAVSHLLTEISPCGIIKTHAPRIAVAPVSGLPASRVVSGCCKVLLEHWRGRLFIQIPEDDGMAVRGSARGLRLQEVIGVPPKVISQFHPRRTGTGGVERSPMARHEPNHLARLSVP